MSSGKTSKKVDNSNNKNGFFIFKVLLITVLIVYFSFTFITQQMQINENSKNLAEVNSQIEEQEERKKVLLEQKEKVNTPEYMEKIAREKLDFVAPDEIVFMDSTQTD